MSREEIVQTASRVFALLMAVWALIEISRLPLVVMTLAHHLRQQSVLAPPDYWVGYYKVEGILIILRTAVLAAVAIWFWSGGTRVLSMLAPSPIPSPGADD